MTELPQILRDSFPHAVLHAVSHDQQAQCREASGDKHHREQKACAQPGSRHQSGSGKCRKSVGAGSDEWAKGSQRTNL